MKLRPTLYLIFLILIVTLPTNCSTNKDKDTNTGTPRISNTTCLAGARLPAGSGLVDIEQAFGNLSFEQPVGLYQEPESSQYWYVIEKTGRIYRFLNEDTTSTKNEFADLSNNVDAQSEGGLIGFAFHPNYKTNGLVFLSYTLNNNGFRSRVSRFDTYADRSAIDLTSERVLIEIQQPYDNHNGGNIMFSPKDGYLYIGFGDGGSGGDPDNNGQDTLTLLGSMLRIDVNVSDDELSNGVTYKNPTDNPFYVADLQCSDTPDFNCPEIFAWGLRNPWRWSFDRLPPHSLWAGDVGQNLWEEVDLITVGKNYGWRCYEGNHDYNTNNCSARDTYEFPVVEYEHPDGASRSITGGYVYRGSQFPELTGSYLYADFESGEIWSLFTPYDTPVNQLLIDTDKFISSFGEGNDGELYFLGLYSGGIYRFVSGSGSTSSPFPADLAQSGCADSSNPKAVPAAMIEYDINSPLWSDGAEKKRWFAVPDNKTIEIKEDGNWEFPIGSVLRKDFYLQSKIIETRLLARHNDGGWGGYSYAWNAEETQATLLSVNTPRQLTNQIWTYPGPNECLLCHSIGALRVLGPETAQMNRLFTDADGLILNQITALNQKGYFHPVVSANQPLDQLVSPNDTSKSLEQRARSYLHANCANCHRPGGPGRGPADFRYNITFSEMNLCNVDPQFGDLGITDAKLLTPGNVLKSIIPLRMRSTNEFRMPDIGSTVVDTEGVAVIEAWIASLQQCS